MSLRAGSWVEVRTKAEILATLDDQGRLDCLQFMPEMFAFCGKRFQVWKRAHKTCDTVNRTGGRRMKSTVHLQELRCDGQAHGGCDAACLLFWKEAWLKPVSGPRERSTNHNRQTGAGCTEEAILRATRSQSAGNDSEPIYSCQATLLPRASEPLKWWDFRQYVEDFTSGNVSLGQLLAGGLYVCYHRLVVWMEGYSPRRSRRLIEIYDRLQRRVGGCPYPRRRGTVPAGQSTPERVLNLQLGEQVRVRPLPEVLATLDSRNRNRGMYFDAEEVPFCGKSFRVRSRVERIIDERTGRMLTLKGRSVILDNVWCQGHYSDRRMMCPRAIYPFWREVWLERLSESHTDACAAAKPPESL